MSTDLCINSEWVVLPTTQQRDVLEVLVEGPVFIQRLLAMQSVPVDTIEDAGRFLDRNWVRLAPYMFQRGAAKSPRSVERLILEIAQQGGNGFTLSFPSQCAVAIDGTVLLPIPGLGGLRIAEPEEFREAREGMRHSGNFCLTRSNAGFSVGIPLLPIVRPLHPELRAQPFYPDRQATGAGQSAALRRLKQVARPRKPSRQLGTKRAGMAVTDFLRAFNNRVAAKLRESRAYATPRFNDLSGRPVSGGLPSLPRRR